MDFALMQWHVRIPILYVQLASVSASESSEILLVYAIKVIYFIIIDILLNIVILNIVSF